MNTNAIQILLQDEPYFRGVYACDQIPSEEYPIPYAMIVNTDPSYKSGEHWVSVFVPSFDVVEYFDPYGGRPMNEEIYRFIKMFRVKKYYNIRLQSYDIQSDTCGFFCILYVSCRCVGVQPNIFQEFFTKYPVINELLSQIYLALSIE